MTFFKTALLTTATVMSLTPIAQAQETKWSGRANFGGFLTDGNTNKKSLLVDGQLKARTENNRYTTSADIRYAEDEGVETEDEYTIKGQYDHFYSEKIFAGLHAKYETDDISDLDSRITAGPFAGYQFYEQDDLNLSTNLGLDYVTEEFANGDEDDAAAVAVGFKYDQKLFQDSLDLQVFHNQGWTIPTDDSEGFLFDSETGVRFPIANILTGTAQVDFDWDNDPAPGVNENDTKYVLKVGYEF